MSAVRSVCISSAAFCALSFSSLGSRGVIGAYRCLFGTSQHYQIRWLATTVASHLVPI
jgi:hypothetical protein